VVGKEDQLASHLRFGRNHGSRRVRLVSVVLVCVVTLIGAGGRSLALKLGLINTQYAAPPQWPLVGDPFVLPAGGQYYVFGSDLWPSKRLPVQVVGSLTQTYNKGNWVALTFEGMPQRPAWAFDDTLWAPTVGLFASGYVLFFSAHYGSTARQCIGRAFASAPGGPYVPEGAPFNCGLDGYRGALDPSLFQGPNGQWYLHAAFADTEAPIYGIPLDAYANAAGAPSLVLGKSFPWEGRFIENPSMTYDWTTNTYLLAYSAGDWWTPSYVTGLARCGTPLGPCSSNPGGPWLVSGSGRTGVGGLSFFYSYDGGTKAVYASFAAGSEGAGQDRAGTVASVALGNAPALGPP